jgi:hypothetical protein
MNKNKEALDELMNGIKYLIDNSKDNGTLILNGIIQSANADKTYNVKINGIIYKNISSILIPLAVGNVVKVIVPQGQYSQMIIIGKINTKSGGGGGNVDPYILPPAKADTLGGVKIGSNLAITDGGKLSATNTVALNFSTDEQIVGTWIDGKPLYQITFLGNEITIPNIDTCFVLFSMAYSPTYNNYDVIPMSEYVCRWSYSKVNSKLTLFDFTGFHSEYFTTIQYTKTTD